VTSIQFTGCDLHIPHKEWSGDENERQNYLELERWANNFRKNCLPTSTSDGGGGTTTVTQRYLTGSQSIPTSGGADINFTTLTSDSAAEVGTLGTGTFSLFNGGVGVRGVGYISFWSEWDLKAVDDTINDTQYLQLEVFCDDNMNYDITQRQALHQVTSTGDWDGTFMAYSGSAYVPNGHENFRFVVHQNTPVTRTVGISVGITFLKFG
jgi:hypothetical protein